MTSALELVRQLDAAARCGQPRSTLDSLFDSLIEAYATLPEDERKRIRIAYNKCSHWSTGDFWMVNPSPNLLFERNGGIDNLRRALAHYSLSDGYPDARDAIVGMSELRAAAARHGIDTHVLFAEMAAISNPDGTWGLQKYMRPNPNREGEGTQESESLSSLKLILYEPPEHAPRVVAEHPTIDEIRNTLRALSWNDITFAVLQYGADNWLEFSGSLEDGFSARYVEMGREFVISCAPASVADGIVLLEHYLSGDDQWRTRHTWCSSESHDTD